MHRREWLIAAGTLTAPGAAAAWTEPECSETEAGYGVLVDLSQCIGCRKCEWACNQANELPNQPIEAFEDKSVFGETRHPDASRFTVVNQFGDGESPVYAKRQCMHCLDPACASACLVSAIERQPNGAVTYDADRCMGCRYCMVACPFQANAYEYNEALAPRVRKCTLCFERLAEEGAAPACVEICPPQCLTFGPRETLLALARRKIEKNPDRYVDHVYGEFEAGGTAWMYISPVSFEEAGFPALEASAPPRFTETLQHSIFRHFIPPAALFLFLAGFMWMTRDEEDAAAAPREGGNAS